MTAGAAFCPRCGSVRAAGSRYCGKCAYDFEPEDKGYSVVGTRPDASGWSYSAPTPAATPVRQGRGGRQKFVLYAGILLATAVGGYLVLNSYGYVPTGNSTPAAATGRIVFGTSVDTGTLKIVGERSQFPLTTKEIAWSASLKEPAGATKLTVILARVNAGGSEGIVDTAEVTISNPAFDTLANSGDLVAAVDNQPGTYVMRYLRGSTILAEGRFTLA